jgi:hypothetical protein
MQDTIALILAIGLILVLLTGTSLRHLWTTPEDVAAGAGDLEAWRDVVMVLIGALSGYIARGEKRDDDQDGGDDGGS